MFQQSLEDLGQPLIDATFVVVDLETTGGSPSRDRITEIGAVKVRAGERLGELSTLVDPGVSVPRAITALTGISDAAVAGRPPVAAVLPSFVEFARGCVLVAHNARFDVGFLNAALRRLDYPPLDHPVLCTAQLARRLVGDELHNHRLASLARHFRSSTVPVHRALADARATVDVLHGLVDRAGSFGVTTVEDLIAFSRVRNMPVFTSRRRMADDLPSAPGVYRFVSASGEVLYIGKATDLRARVRQYFGTDRRRRIAQLVEESARVDHTVTPTVVEAEVLESRLIREHRPRFNRRGTAVRKPVWIALTREPYPRLTVLRRPPRDDAVHLGPLPSRRVADQVVAALQDAFPIRRCTTRMAAATRFPPCALAEIGRCAAPCDGQIDVDGYAGVARAVEAALEGDVGPALEVLRDRMARRAADGRYEEAADVRDRIGALVTHLVRARHDAALRAAGTLVVSRPVRAADRRELLVVRGGWLLGTAVVPASGWDAADLLGRDAPSHAPPPEELGIISRWLDGAGVRVEHCDRVLAWPVGSGAAMAEAQAVLTAARSDAGRAEGYLATKRLARQG